LCVHDDDDFKLNQNVEYGGRKTRANEKMPFGSIQVLKDEKVQLRTADLKQL